MNKDDKTLDSQIESMMEQLTIEKAPASLSLRLNRIPEEESRKERLKERRWSWLKPGSFPRWAMVPAFAAVPLLVAVVMLMQPRQPSPEEVEQGEMQVAAEDEQHPFYARVENHIDEALKRRATGVLLEGSHEACIDAVHWLTGPDTRFTCTMSPASRTPIRALQLDRVDALLLYHVRVIIT